MKHSTISRLAAVSLVSLFSASCGRTVAEPIVPPLSLAATPQPSKPQTTLPPEITTSKKSAEPCDPTPTMSFWPPLVISMRLCGGM